EVPCLRVPILLSWKRHMTSGHSPDHNGGNGMSSTMGCRHCRGLCAGAASRCHHCGKWIRKQDFYSAGDPASFDSAQHDPTGQHDALATAGR
ncbi:MAG: hypothetical protein ACYC2O_08275, partial [Microthrixaceae bacterium]